MNTSKRIIKRKQFGDNETAMELDTMFTTNEAPHIVVKFIDDGKKRIFQNPKDILRLTDDEPYSDFKQVEADLRNNDDQLKVAALWEEHGCHYEAMVLKVTSGNSAIASASSSSPKIDRESTKKQVQSKNVTELKSAKAKKKTATEHVEDPKRKKKMAEIVAKAAVVRQVLDIDLSDRPDPAPETFSVGEQEDTSSEVGLISEDSGQTSSHISERERALTEEVAFLNKRLEMRVEQVFKLEKENQALKVQLERAKNTTHEHLNDDFSSLKASMCNSSVQSFVKELVRIQDKCHVEAAGSKALPSPSPFTASSPPSQSAVQLIPLALPHLHQERSAAPGTVQPPTIPISTRDTVSSPPPQTQTSSEQELIPGSGVFISKLKLSAIIAKGSASMSRLTKHLLEVFFEDEVLASSNYDGGGPNNYTSLDKKITSALKDFVRQRFPGTKDRDIVQKINEKCVDTRKLLKKKLQTSKPSSN